jgi:hypothetical protein
MNNSLTFENKVVTPEQEEATGLPYLSTWQSTYIFTVASFILWIILLFALTEFFS